MRRSSDRTVAVYVCNPNNPTGTAVDPVALRRFTVAMAARCPVLLELGGPPGRPRV